jgi:hypothetical protein
MSASGACRALQNVRVRMRALMTSTERNDNA